MLPCYGGVDDQRATSDERRGTSSLQAGGIGLALQTSASRRLLWCPLTRNYRRALLYGPAARGGIQSASNATVSVAKDGTDRYLKYYRHNDVVGNPS